MYQCATALGCVSPGAFVVGGAQKAGGVRPRNYVDVISISCDRLQILIQKFSEQIENRLFWITPLGVAISLFWTLIVSDFKDKFYLKGVEWRLITIIAFLVFAVWTVCAFIKSSKGKSLDDLMEEISSSSLAPLRRYGLPVFWAKDSNGTNHVLLYFDQTWDCYLCPYVSLHSDQSDPEDVSEPAADRFGLPKQALQARELVGHVVRSQKRSEASHNITNYLFAFYPIKVNAGYEGTFGKRKFEVQGRWYHWLTVEEVLSHARSVERNGEVLRYIRDHRQVFFDEKMSLSLRNPIVD